MGILLIGGLKVVYGWAHGCVKISILGCIVCASALTLDSGGFAPVGNFGNAAGCSQENMVSIQSYSQYLERSVMFSFARTTHDCRKVGIQVHKLGAFLHPGNFFCLRENVANTAAEDMRIRRVCGLEGD